ncbi:MAG: helicase HerA domain-containing protein [Candidatus Nanoarchaeia archaeon]
MGIKDRFEAYVNSKRKEITVEEALANPKKYSGKKRKYVWRSSALLVLLFSLLVLTILGLYTGYVSYHEGQGGYIYGMNILFTRPAYNWAGIYGASFGVGVTQPWSFEIEPGSMTEANVFFSCFEKGIDHEIYASIYPEVEIDMNNLMPATLDDVDAFISITNNSYDSAHFTFDKYITVNIGSRTIANVPATYTRVGIGTNTTAYDIGVLKDGTKLVFVSHVYPTLTKGFNNRFYNYQLLLPLSANGSATYYLWSDPNDICLGGDQDPESLGGVQGNVTDASGNLLPDVIVVVAGVSTISDDVGFYNLTPEIGTQIIIAIKEGYQVYENTVNITENQITIHNIVLELESPPNDYTDVGPDYNSNSDVGPDVGPGEVPYQVQSPTVVEGQDYIIALQSINKKLREGEFIQDVLIIQSMKSTAMNLQFKINGEVANLTKMDKENLIVGPRSQGMMTLTFFGNQPPGVYNGSINISGGLNVEIPLTVEVLDKDKIPIQALLMTLSTPGKKLYSGSTLTFRNDLTNLLSDQAYPVKLTYSVQTLDGTTTFWDYSTNVFITTSLSILKNVELPADLKEGDYVIRVTANYQELSSSASHVFTVNLPFYQYILFGKLRVWHAGLILLALGSILAAILVIRKRLEAKKRYHLKVEMNELPKIGPRSIWVGKLAETEHKTYMNLENFKTHTIVAGSTGGGKSFSAQVIIEEMLLKDVAIIVFDPTAQWTGMLRKLTNKGLMGLYPNFGMKPTDARAFTGNIRQINNARELIDIKKYMKPGEIQIFACHKLDPKEIDMFVANTVREVFHANFDESEPLRLVLVYDEVHRLLPKFGGSGEGFLQIERACREFRKWGIGVVLISQVLADFVGQIKANINTEVQMRTRDEGDLDRIKTKYGAEILQSLVKASVGTGMVQNSAYNRGKPYFVTFRPIMHSVTRLSDDEIEQYNKYNEQISQLAYELEQLEGLKQDVFDLKMELKLALDKVKSGNFNMVQIYLEGLVPRVKKLWDKLGQKPLKREIKVISEDVLKEELAKAKADRVKFEAENKKVDGEEKKEESPAEKFKKDVSPDKILHLHNDMLVVNPKSLFSEIEAMKDSDFKFHVTDSKNDFADWIRTAINDDELADNLAQVKTKEEIMKLLDMREKGQKLPKVEKKAEVAADVSATLSSSSSAQGEKSQATEVNSAEIKTGVKEESKEKITEIKTSIGIDAKVLDNVSALKELSKEPAFANKKSALDIVAPEDKVFKLEDGEELKSLQDLLNKIDGMPEDVFKAHVNNDKNDFANWTKNVFEKYELADRMWQAKTKNELKEVLIKVG